MYVEGLKEGTFVERRATHGFQCGRAYEDNNNHTAFNDSDDQGSNNLQPASIPIDVSGNLCVVPPLGPKRIYWFQQDNNTNSTTDNTVTVWTVLLLQDNHGLEEHMDFDRCRTSGCSCRYL